MVFSGCKDNKKETIARFEMLQMLFVMFHLERKKQK